MFTKLENETNFFHYFLQYENLGQEDIKDLDEYLALTFEIFAIFQDLIY